MRSAWLAALVLVACRDPRSAPPPPAPVSPAPAGNVRRAPVPTVLMVLIGVGDAAELVATARARGLAADAVTRHPFVDVELDADKLAWAAPGLSPAEREALLRSTDVIELRAEGADGFASFTKLAPIAADLAAAAKGWVFDTNTLTVFTPDKMRGRITPALDVRKLIVVHAVTGGHKQPFLDTLGMARLGLPELYVRATAQGRTDDVTFMVDAAAQVLATRGDVTVPGELAIDLATFDASWGLDEIRAAGGTGKAVVELRWSKAPDDDELSLELVPRTGSGTDDVAALIGELEGKVADEPVDIRADDPELLAAAVRARADLAKRKSHFARGIPTGEQLLVKTSFTGDDGVVEWMWVDVVGWRGDKLTGTLDNDPEHPMKLRLGSEVSVALQDVADFLHRTASGDEGGYSIEVFKRRGLVP